MLLVKYTGLIFEMRFEMFQIVMFLLSVPVTFLCGGQSWGLKIGFGFPTFLAKRATFPAAGKVAGWPEDFVLKTVKCHVY